MPANDVTAAAAAVSPPRPTASPATLAPAAPPAPILTESATTLVPAGSASPATAPAMSSAASPPARASGVGAMFALLMRSVVADLRLLKAWQAVAVTLFGLLSIAFSIIDFNAFINPEVHTSPIKWVNDTNAGKELWKRILVLFSGVASFSGVLCVVLVSLGRFSNYFWGIINCVTYGVAALAMDYSGDFQLNIFFFLPMQFVGMYTWYYHLDSADTAQAASLGWLRWLATVLLMFALGVGMYYEIPAFSRALAGVYAYEDMPWPHALDAASVTLSIAAQVLQTGRFWEQWLAWIAVDIVQIAMFAGIAGFGIDFNLITMWSLFLINAVIGAVLWYRRSRDPDASAAKPDPERALATTNENVNSSLSTLADGATPPHSPLDHAPSDTEVAPGTPRTGLLNASVRS